MLGIIPFIPVPNVHTPSPNREWPRHPQFYSGNRMFPLLQSYPFVQPIFNPQFLESFHCNSIRPHRKRSDLPSPPVPYRIIVHICKLSSEYLRQDGRETGRVRAVINFGGFGLPWEIDFVS